MENYNADKIEFVQEKPNRILKIIALVAIIAPILFLVFLGVISIGKGPGETEGLSYLVLPLMPILWVFFPVYFFILSFRYAREKSNMDLLDKIAFYILLVFIGGFWMLAMSTLFR